MILVSSPSDTKVKEMLDGAGSNQVIDSWGSIGEVTGDLLFMIFKIGPLDMSTSW